MIGRLNEKFKQQPVLDSIAIIAASGFDPGSSGAVRLRS
jgi:hypothetical protein